MMDPQTDQDLQKTEGLLALWASVLLPPIIVAIQMETNFVLVRHACSAQRNGTLYAVNIIALLITIGSVFNALRSWKRNTSNDRNETNAVRFVSGLGLLSCGLFVLVIIAQGIATLYFDPCQL